MAGATLRLRNATLTVSMAVAGDGFGEVTFHCTYRAAGTLMFPSAALTGVLHALQVASGVRVLPERKAMARRPLSMSSPSMRNVPNLEKRSTSFAAERNSARGDGVPSMRYTAPVLVVVISVSLPAVEMETTCFSGTVASSDTSPSLSE